MTSLFEPLKSILAIDPGTHRSAMIQWDGFQILGKWHLENQLFKETFTGLIEIKREMPVYCEMIASYGMPVGVEVFETCLFIGNLQQITSDHGQQFQKVYRKDVKMHLCNSVRAKDGNIRQALVDRLGLPGTKKEPGATYGIAGDMWAALAVAVYSFDTYHSKSKQAV